jgi:hypothetical protein
LGKGRYTVVYVLNEASRHAGVWVTGGTVPGILNLGTDNGDGQPSHADNIIP